MVLLASESLTEVFLLFFHGPCKGEVLMFLLAVSIAWYFCMLAEFLLQLTLRPLKPAGLGTPGLRSEGSCALNLEGDTVVANDLEIN